MAIAAIVTASLLWSVTYLIRKHVALELGPFTVTFIEAFSGAVLTALIYRIRPRAAVKLVKSGGWMAILMGLFGVTIANSALVYGFRFIDLGIASILEKTQPIFTVILAAAFLNEKLSRPSMLLGLCGLVGAVIIVPFSFGDAASLDGFTWQTGLGVAAVILAAITWAAAGVLGRKLAVDEMGPANMAFMRAAVGAFTCLPLMLIFEAPHIDFHAASSAYALAGLNGLIDSAICYVLYYRGMKYIKAGTTSIIEILTPAGAVFLGVTVLGEHLSLRQIGGAVIVLASVTALVFTEIRHHAKSQQKKVAVEFKP